jgi:hypothetical protein
MSTPTATTIRRLLLIPLYFLLASYSHATMACSDSTGACCKVCKDGKACGDTCIARTDTCHAGAGCACQG